MRFPTTGMTVRSVRISVAALLAAIGVVIASFAGLAPAAQAAEALGVESFFAGNCKAGHEACNKAEHQSEEVEKAEKEGYTQAAGHPPYGVTEFKVATAGKAPKEVPLALVTHVRTDVGPGVSTNPEAMEKCSFAEFGETEALPGTG